jgi:hypothetical protein
MALVIDSPVLVTSTPFEPVAMGLGGVGEVGLLIFFQGPGESLDNSGEGKGVTSPIAVIIGLGIAEFAPNGVASALATASLTLGVRERGRSDVVDDVLCRNEEDLSARRLALRIGVVGSTSVCMRSGAVEKSFGLFNGVLCKDCW